MKIALGSDHRGVEIVRALTEHLRHAGHETAVLGNSSGQPCDYPDNAYLVARAVVGGAADLGILVCGSGIGMSMAANKVPGIRASICHDAYSARQGVEHDNMNVLCLGARVIGFELAVELVTAFLNAVFSGEERYRRRLKKVQDIEQRYLKGT